VFHTTESEKKGRVKKVKGDHHMLVWGPDRDGRKLGSRLSPRLS